MAIETIAVGAELAKALVAAHAEIHNPKTDSENSYFSSRYTSLGACRNAAVPMLAKHGITLMQDLTTTKIADLDGQMLWATECRTLLVHESGQALLFGPLTLPAKEGTAQALGSSGTYGRRYSLCGATSIAPTEDDDDGNAATHIDSNTTTAGGGATVPKLTTDSVSGLPPRPTGQFAYGKKFVNVPWNIMNTSDLIWFRDADRTPAVIRERCKAELAWREAGQRNSEAIRAQQADQDAQPAPDDSDIPF
jgi:ERF superfamily